MEGMDVPRHVLLRLQVPSQVLLLASAPNHTGLSCPFLLGNPEAYTPHSPCHMLPATVLISMSASSISQTDIVPNLSHPDMISVPDFGRYFVKVRSQILLNLQILFSPQVLPPHYRQRNSEPNPYISSGKPHFG